MKIPDSGMPDEEYWESLFNVPLILDRLGIDRTISDMAELGCGYGTFTIPTAHAISGSLFAYDIEPVMIDRAQARVGKAGLRNVQFTERDVIADGFSLPDHSVDAVLLFNILHFSEPQSLIAEAARILRPNGRVLVIHWRSDLKTPRGPAMEVRPRYEQIKLWAATTKLAANAELDLPPWHFGVVLEKNNSLIAHQTDSSKTVQV
jgi:ubiquinone/menaquinone biosynthesis C-methylase UbiE